MMDAVEFLKELQRRSKNNPNYYGEELNIAYIEPVSLVAQVEEWAKEHPAKTRQSEFLKMFPDAKINDAAILAISPCTLDAQVRKDCNGDCNRCRREYWLQEAE